MNQFEIQYFEFFVFNCFSGCLETSRRGMWNIFRVENEIMNNAGKFRALNLDLVPPHQSPHSEEYDRSIDIDGKFLFLSELASHRLSNRF